MHKVGILIFSKLQNGGEKKLENKISCSFYSFSLMMKYFSLTISSLLSCPALIIKKIACG